MQKINKKITFFVKNKNKTSFAWILAEKRQNFQKSFTKKKNIFIMQKTYEAKS
jgi:hypothetical protein